MFDFLLVAQALGIINDYFNEEASDQDFWDPPSELYHQLETEKLWFMINPQKLKEKYRKNAEILIVSDEEKKSVLKAFLLLRQYSKMLPDNAHLNERLLVAKKYLPPVFFEPKPHKDRCKILWLNPKGT